MIFRRLCLTLSASILILAGAPACTDQTSPPTAPPDAAGARTGAPTQDLTAPEPDRHMLLAKGSAQRLQQRVEELGGHLDYFHPPTGFGMVSGLGTEAARLAGDPLVQELHRDVALSLERPREPVQLAMERIQSQENPMGAILFSWQWNLELIGAPAAWAAGHLGSPDVTVAILDTGIDYDAFDLAGLVDLSRSASFVPGDDALVAALFPGRHPISDLNGHGTNVATQVASTAFAFAGVSSRTTLLGVKVLGARGSGTLGGVLQGMLWAADNGADVLNMSLGGAFLKRDGQRLVGLLRQVATYVHRQGALVVVAAGNDALNLDGLGFVYFAHCDDPNVVCVGAVGPGVATADPDEPAIYTNFGRSAIQVAGPGGNFRDPLQESLWPWGLGIASWVWSLCSKTLLVFDEEGNPIAAPCAAGNFILGGVGTSQASPHVAGLAALLMAEHGSENPSRIAARIRQSAQDLGQPGTDPFYGKGRIDVAAALLEGTP